MKQILSFLRKTIGNRVLWTLIIVVAIFTGLIRNLYIMQILNKAEYTERMYEDTVEEFSLGGARGNIYDCYGRPLAINTTSKSLYYKTDSENPALNDSLLKLLDTLAENKEELAISNELPIRYDPYTGFYFTDRYANPTGTARLNFLAEIFGTKRSDLTEEQAASSAEDAYYRMRDITFSIDPSLPMETVLVLMNIRYVFFQNRWNPEEPVLVAENIGEKTQAIVLEQSDRYVGFYVETEYTRTYPQGKYFAHIIGYTGRISEEELERNKDKGYTESDMIGKAGLESAYEEDLEDYDKYIRGANCEIVYFITSDVTPEERFQIQKKYDTEKDYTFYKPDEELREGAEYIVEQSILMKAQCEKLGLPYYETARDREQVFMQFLRDFGFI